MIDDFSRRRWRRRAFEPRTERECLQGREHLVGNGSHIVARLAGLLQFLAQERAVIAQLIDDPVALGKDLVFALELGE